MRNERIVRLSERLEGLTHAYDCEDHAGRRRQVTCFESLDLKATRSLDKGLIRDPFTCRWLTEHRLVIWTGATGTGNTWIACVLVIRRRAEASACFTPGCRACRTTSRPRASALEPAL
ncbi:ATP-binding protein [Skermanella rosea]|uniref:ATP-binding protein n=1 Tax=Skermanella rosea TaxID=1817965 RepID=UPI0019331F2F